jgi:hypothetical protein
MRKLLYRWMFWAGLALLAQAIGFLPIRGFFDETTMWVSLGFGVLGALLVFVRRRWGQAIANDGCDAYLIGNAELYGEQALELGDSIDAWGE